MTSDPYGKADVSDEVIGGYRLLKHLVTGQASQVWEVRDASGQHFAMKLLLPEKATQSQFRHFLLHEAEVGKELAHPNIIRIVHVDRDPKNPYFVMEFFPAGNLKLRIQRKETPFIREKGQDILKQIATGLAFMNAKGWVHRDVKPDNILVNSAGEVKLIDFAIAQRIPTGMAKWFQRRGKPQGTRSYMSPEQIRGKALDGRADVYSFAATAFEFVTGRPPFRGASNQDLLVKHISEKPASPMIYNPDVTKEFSELVLQMLAKKKEDRPTDFHEVLMRMRTLKVFKGGGTPPVKE
ncbi:MAG TPA: serine/threonine protein kinase [Planctomycetales bacterium]|nr:serine/threonine protein kinase [Planctomycetales bacterium]